MKSATTNQATSKKNPLSAVIAQAMPAGKAATIPAASPKLAVELAKKAAPKTKAQANAVTVIDTKPDNISHSTVAYKVFAGIEKQTKLLHAWFDENREHLFKTVASGKVQKDVAGAYKRAFEVVHTKNADTPLHLYPFYKSFENALGYWVKNVSGVDITTKPSSTTPTNKIRAYLDKHTDDVELIGGVTSFIAQKMDKAIWDAMKASIDAMFEAAK